jgi:hypothetical protein
VIICAALMLAMLQMKVTRPPMTAGLKNDLPRNSRSILNT